MRRYKKSDLKEVNQWRAAHQFPLLTHAELPKVGIIEPGVAAVFLYQCEGGLGWVEGLITNPAASSEARNLAFDAGWRMIAAEAKAAGVKKLIATPISFESAKRTVEAGFQIQPGHLLALMTI